MKIKEYNKDGLLIGIAKFLKNYKILGGLIVLLVYSCILIFLGGVLHKDGFFGRVFKPAIKANIRIPFNYMKGVFSKTDHLYIDIKHMDFQKLAYKRKIALEKGVLHPFPEDFVPARIKWNDKTIKVDLRLKGDLKDHWARDRKWSFRIKTKGNKSILGMRRFSIQHPFTRGFMNDWFLHKMLDKLKFITLRYGFIDVTINGKYLGIYAIEEHFEKRLIENNKRVDAPIIRIKDHLLWYLVETIGGFTEEAKDEIYSLSPIDAFNTNTVNQDETLLNNFKKAKNLLESFRRGKLSTHQVFDIEKLADLFAVIDLLGYRHTTAYSNLRFYYNPITSYLVPIGYDNTFIQEASSIEGQAKEIQVARSDIITLPEKELSSQSERLNWRSTFFKDRKFYLKYIEALEKIANKQFLDNLFNETDDEYKENLHIIYKNFPGYSFEKEKATLYKNQQFIRKILNPVESIQAYFKNADEKESLLTLELGNIQFLPVEVLNVSFNEYIFPITHGDVILQPKTRFSPIDFCKIRFNLPEGFEWTDLVANNLKVNYRIFGTNNIKNIPVFPWSYLDEDFFETDFIRQKPNFNDFDFILVDEEAKKVLIKPGSWRVNKNLIIPKGYTVFCGDDTRLNLTNDSKILSYSPLMFVGSRDNPIVIHSKDSSGQGIVVMSSDEKSIIENVIFRNLSVPSQGGWQLYGAVTFYESPVEINMCQFIGSRNGSGLNIIRSEFNVNNTRFERTYSDAISVVFGKGRVANSSFIKINGNVMSFSGSIVQAENILIDTVTNIGISADKNSCVNVKNIEIRNAGIAVVSKDKSEVFMENVKISDTGTGFEVFQENDEYGPAIINVKLFKSKNVKRAYNVEEKSLLVIGGKEILGNNKRKF